MSDVCCFPECSELATKDVVVNDCVCSRACDSHHYVLVEQFKRQWVYASDSRAQFLAKWKAELSQLIEDAATMNPSQEAIMEIVQLMLGRMWDDVAAAV